MDSRFVARYDRGIRDGTESLSAFASDDVPTTFVSLPCPVVHTYPPPLPPQPDTIVECRLGICSYRLRQEKLPRQLQLQLAARRSPRHVQLQARQERSPRRLQLQLTTRKVD